MSPTSPLTPKLIADLLAQPTFAAQVQFLQQANLWHEAGLAELIQAGGQLINIDLPQARLLLDACIALAPELSSSLRPQAIYLRAQTFAMSGEATPPTMLQTTLIRA
jgi:hypothetical protein